MTQEEFIDKDANTRKGVFNYVAEQKGVSGEVVEKDFWVTFILGRLFSDTKLSNILRFKGGTSLSKGYGIIDRFSEDIDLVIDWSEVAPEDGGYDVKRMADEKTPEYVRKDLTKKVPAFVKDKLVDNIKVCLEGILLPKFEKPNKNDDSSIIRIEYQSVYEEDSYVKASIKLEIGALGAPCPSEPKGIKSLVSAYEASIESPDVKVAMVTEYETFWEKITILHQESHRDEAHPYREGAMNRVSRHYYDVYNIICKRGIETLINEIPLLETARWYTESFHYRRWACLEDAKRGSLKLCPSRYAMPFIKQDYSAMRDMIWGEYHDFETMLAKIEEFQDAVNG